MASRKIGDTVILKQDLTYPKADGTDDILVNKGEVGVVVNISRSSGLTFVNWTNAKFWTWVMPREIQVQE